MYVGFLDGDVFVGVGVFDVVVDVDNKHALTFQFFLKLEHSLTSSKLSYP